MSSEHKIDPFLKFTKYSEKIEDFTYKNYFNNATKDLIIKICQELSYLKNVIDTSNPFECVNFNCEKKIYFKVGDHMMNFVRYHDTIIKDNDITQDNQIYQICNLPNDKYLTEQDYTNNSYENLLKSQVILGYFYYCKVNVKLKNINELNNFTKNIVKIVIETLDRMSK